MRYRTRYRPASTILGRHVELALTAKSTATPVAQAEPPEQCTPNITGLVWLTPVTLVETNIAVIELQTVETDFDLTGPQAPVEHTIPNSNFFWEARIKGTLCCDCEVEWDTDWSGTADEQPGFRGRWDWAVLTPTEEAPGAQIDQGTGVLTVTATVTCPGMAPIEVGPITAVVSMEGGGGS